MKPRRCLAALALLVVLVAGCGFSPTFPGGSILCGVPPERRCPEGLLCDQEANLCLAPGQSIGKDAGGDAPDGGDDASPDDGARIDGPPRPVLPSADDCNVFDPAACPAGQTCRTFCVGDLAAVARCEAVGSVALGQICSREERCGAGASCVQHKCPRSGVLRFCERTCANDADCPGGSCRPLACGEAFRTCTQACDPRDGAANTCPEGASCYVDPGDVVGCDCTRAAFGVDGYRCDIGPLGACGPGFVCTAERGSNVCRPLCPRDTAPCAAGRTCLPVPGFQKWGACVPDPGPDITPSGCDATSATSCGKRDGKDQVCRAVCGDQFSGTAACQGVSGGVRPGGACTADFQCVPGASCVARACGGTTTRSCEQWCKIDADCGGAGSRCSSISCGGRPSPFRVCTRPCDPRGATTGCPEGLACRLSRGDRTDCACPTATAGREGSPCQLGLENTCGPGLLCAGPAASSSCRRVCLLSAGDCPTGTRCTSVADHVLHGACLPAPPEPPPCDPAVTASCPTGMACAILCDPSGKPDSLFTSCLPAGTVPPGQSCGSSADCTAGHLCAGAVCADGLARRTCNKHCRTDAECGGNARCLQAPCGSLETPYGRCTTSCDPVGTAATGCLAGTNCVLIPGDGTECLCPRPTQTGGDGESCTGFLTCRPGFTCIHEGAARTCRAICRLEGPSTCPTDRRCSALPDQRAFGACVPAPR